MIILSNAIKTYKEILNDLNNPENKDCHHLNRSILLPNKIRILYIIIAASKQRMIAVKIPNEHISLSSFPKWKGIEFKTGTISDYDNYDQGNNYVIISQSHGCDSSIFEVIANDISEELYKAKNTAKTVECIKSTINKWKQFFSLNSDIVMSDAAQMGLYGELLVLKKLICQFGEKAVGYWCGAEKETHDFYLFGSAVEVKTTASKSEIKVKISSEHQLDCTDIEKNLVLYVNIIRKSSADGEKLPALIDEIQSLLSSEMKDEFDKKLFMYGYIPSFKDKYDICFYVRAKKIFWVNDNFPCITPKDLSTGISEVTYTLDLNVCTDFSVSWEKAIARITERK